MQNKIENIELLQSLALDMSEYEMPEPLFLNALFFYTASAMGLKNIRVKRETNRGDKLIIPSYYAYTFGSQGIGKDHASNICRSIFQSMFDSMEVHLQDFYERNKDRDGKPDPRYLNLSSYFVPVSSTQEGIQKSAQTICDLGYGSVNVVADELGDTINKMDAIFSKLKTAWDTGISEGAVTVSSGGENYFSVKDMCFNALLFGAPAPFELDDKKKDRLLESYVSGMARRSFIYHNNTYKKSENRNPNFESMSMEESGEIDQYIKELRNHINATDFIVYPQEIKNKLTEYDTEKEIIRDRSPSLIAQALGASKKIEKLMGILAILDLSSVITEKHLYFAIEFTELLDATAEETVEIKPNYIKIYNELEKRNYTARTDIIKAVKDVSIKSFDSEIILVMEHASLAGNTLIKKEYDGVVKYKLEKMSETSLDKIILSANEDPNKTNPSGFVRYEGEFKNLHNIINSNMRYSAGTFKGQYINDNNYMQEQNLFIIDVDEDMSIVDAKSLFSGYTYLISTTKSHQKMKNGVQCDRFRIILPTTSRFHLEPEIYAKLYMNVINALGIPEADEKCKNASRWYYGNPDAEYWYNDGQLLDIRTFIPDSSEQHEAVGSLSKYESDEEHAPTDTRVQGAMKWFLSNTSKGNRNDQLYLLGQLLKDPNRIGTEDWEHWVVYANTCLLDPMLDRDVQTILRSLNRR